MSQVYMPSGPGFISVGHAMTARPLLSIVLSQAVLKARPYCLGRNKRQSDSWRRQSHPLSPLSQHRRPWTAWCNRWSVLTMVWLSWIYLSMGVVINTPGPIGLPDRSRVAPIITPVTPVDRSSHRRSTTIHLSRFPDFLLNTVKYLVARTSYGGRHAPSVFT